MNHTTHKIASLFRLALTLALAALFLVHSLAETIYTEGFLWYVIENDSVTIVGYFGKDTEVTVPSSIAGLPVNRVRARAFAGTAAKTVRLPDTVLTMGLNAVRPGTKVIYNANTDKPINDDSDPEPSKPQNTPAPAPEPEPTAAPIKPPAKPHVQPVENSEPWNIEEPEEESEEPQEGTIAEGYEKEPDGEETPVPTQTPAPVVVTQPEPAPQKGGITLTGGICLALLLAIIIFLFLRRRKE